MPIRPILWLLLLLILMNACIDPLDFPRFQDQDLVVVDGLLTDDEEGPHYVRLSRTAEVGRSKNFRPITEAMVRLYDDLGQFSFYVEEAPGVYRLPPTALIKAGVPGRSYRLEIQLRNGVRYESRPQKMPEKVRADSTTFVTDGVRRISIYNNLTIPERAAGPFFRWKIVRVYSVFEIVCSPLDPANVCYVTEPQRNDQVVVLDASNFQPGQSIRQFVRTWETDRTFGLPQFFNVTLETIDREAYTYFEKVDALLSQQGSIFDAPPGTIRGNISRVSDPDEVVLGFFYVAPADTTRVKTIASDYLPQVINPYCGIPGFPPIPFLTECCNCLRLDNSTLEQPDYWEE